MCYDMRMKICSVCRQKKNLTEFHTDRATPDKKTYRCKMCAQKHNRKHKATRQAYQVKRRTRNQKLLREARDKPCVDCGTKLPPDCMAAGYLGRRSPVGTNKLADFIPNEGAHSALADAEWNVKVYRAIMDGTLNG